MIACSVKERIWFKRAGKARGPQALLLKREIVEGLYFRCRVKEHGPPLSARAASAIKRFSEDIDFKVGEPAAGSASRARRERTAYRERVLDALTSAGFQLEEKPVIGNESRFFSAALAYGGEYGVIGERAKGPLTRP